MYTSESTVTFTYVALNQLCENFNEYSSHYDATEDVPIFRATFTFKELNVPPQFYNDEKKLKEHIAKRRREWALNIHMDQVSFDDFNTRSSVKIDEERDTSYKSYNQWKEYEESNED